MGVPGAGAVRAGTALGDPGALGGRVAVPRRRLGGVLLGAAARPPGAVQLPAERLGADHHGGQLLRVRCPNHHRVRPHDGAAPRRGHPRRARACDAAVSRPQPAVRGRAVRGRRGAALASRRRLDGRDDGPALVAVRGEHPLRVDCHEAWRSTRPRGDGSRAAVADRRRHRPRPLRTGRASRPGLGSEAFDDPRRAERQRIDTATADWCFPRRPPAASRPPTRSWIPSSASRAFASRSTRPIP